MITPLGDRAGSPLLVGPPPSVPEPPPHRGRGRFRRGNPAGLRQPDGLCAVTACAWGFFRTEHRPSRWPGLPAAKVPRPRPSAAAAPPDETRRQRRRRLGIPRRITFRVILFILLVAGVPVGAYFAIRWYAYEIGTWPCRTTRSW